MIILHKVILTFLCNSRIFLVKEVAVKNLPSRKQTEIPPKKRKLTTLFYNCPNLLEPKYERKLSGRSLFFYLTQKYQFGSGEHVRSPSCTVPGFSTQTFDWKGLLIKRAKWNRITLNWAAFNSSNVPIKELGKGFSF